MIVKPHEQTTVFKEPRQQAGAAAERQMAHYLHRSFNEDRGVFVLHDLRLEDHAQREHDGSTGVCQIDHLLVHRWGLFIIESKSVTEEVRVRSDDSGGDEWSRVYRRKEMGMPSPIRQAQRQADFLRAFLQRHREEMLGKRAIGFRTIAKLAEGSDQRGFKWAPIQLVIAVSDKGKIKRLGGWKEPSEPFRVFVTKADLVPDKIGQELEQHRKSASIMNAESAGRYGMWSMKALEVEQVAEFLAARHVDRSGASSARSKRTASNRNRKSSRDKPASTGHSAKTICKHCDSKDLTARSGRYGYYWRCGMCKKNTAMPVVCSACAAEGKRNKEVRVRKDKTTYFRDCEACGTSETIWTED